MNGWVIGISFLDFGNDCFLYDLQVYVIFICILGGQNICLYNLQQFCEGDKVGLWVGLLNDV